MELLLNQVFKYLQDIRVISGVNSVSKKHKIFQSCIQESRGLVLKLFNPTEKLRLGVNTSIIHKAIQKATISRPLRLIELFQLHEQISLAEGPGSIQKKIVAISKVFSGVDAMYHHLIIDYYTKTMFKIGYSLATVSTLLCEMYPLRKTEIKKSVETGTSYYEIYCSCTNNEEIPHGLFIKPMLASTHSIQKDVKYLVELKLDGIRLLFKKEKNSYSCWTRSGLILDPEGVLNILPIKDKVSILSLKEDFILDGELWIPSSKAGEGFRLILPIIKSKRKTKINAYYSIFDIPYYKESLHNIPLYKRKEILSKLGLRTLKHTSFNVKGLPKLMELVKKSVYEGVVLKEEDSVYESGKRSNRWIKIKPHPQTLDVIITGAQKGTGK